MATLTYKVQILLDDQQHRELLALAKTQGKTLSALLREAVVEHLLKEARRSARQKAFEEIRSMTLPVGDWPEMEKEIASAHASIRKRR